MRRDRPLITQCRVAVVLTAIIAVLSSCSNPLFTARDGLDPETREGIVNEIESRVLESFPFFAGSYAAGRLVPESGDEAWPTEQSFRAAIAGLRDSSLGSETSDRAFLDEVITVLAGLGDGHTSAGPIPYGQYPGIRLRYFAGDTEGIFVEELISRRGTEPDGIRVGDRIIAIADLGRLGDDPTGDEPATVEELLDAPDAQWDVLFGIARRFVFASNEDARSQLSAAAVFSVALRGRNDPAADVAVRVERAGAMIDLSISAGRADDALPVVYAPYSESITHLGNRYRYIAVPSMRYMDDIDRIDRLVNSAITRGDDAIVFDLRGNGGGQSAIGDYLIARLALSDRARFRIVDAEGTTVRTIGPQNPRGTQFVGAVALLVDHHVFSAANHFVSLVADANERGLFGSRPVVVVGGRTGGGSGVPTGVRLTRDFAVRVSRQLTVDPDGRHYERGVSPTPGGDVLGGLSPDDLGANRYLAAPTQAQFGERLPGDLILQRALAMLGAALEIE